MKPFNFAQLSKRFAVLQWSVFASVLLAMTSTASAVVVDGLFDPNEGYDHITNVPFQLQNGSVLPNQGILAWNQDAQGNVYVADAGNKRIQVFDAEGTFKSEFGNVGTPLAMCITRGSMQYLYISHAGDEDGMEDAAIYKVALDGRVLGKFGAAGKLPKQFGLANSIDCRDENVLLVGEMTNWRVQKLTLRQTQASR